jgi:septin family protein
MWKQNIEMYSMQNDGIKSVQIQNPIEIDSKLPIGIIASETTKKHEMWLHMTYGIKWYE